MPFFLQVVQKLSNNTPNMSTEHSSNLLANGYVRTVLAIGLPILITWFAFPSFLHWNLSRFVLNSPEAYEQHVAKYPGSPFRELAGWRRARMLDIPEAYVEFAAEFPKSKHHEYALWHAASLENTPEGYWRYFSQYPAGDLASKLSDRKLGPLKASAYKYKQDQDLAQKANYGEVKDNQGGVYRTIKVGGKTWTADNLNAVAGEGSYCFGSHENYCLRYGRLYDWDAAQKICQTLGPGWHLPTEADWNELASTYGGGANWYSGDKPGNRAFRQLSKDGVSGFQALAGGFLAADRKYRAAYFMGAYWTSTSKGPQQAAHYVFDFKDRRIYTGNEDKSVGMSCRCVQDVAKRAE
jgi:uncharacterized protein (TIGR02145 family)